MSIHADLTDPQWVAQARDANGPRQEQLQYVYVDQGGRRVVATDGFRLHLAESPDPVVATEENGIYRWDGRLRAGWPQTPPVPDINFPNFEGVLDSVKARLWRHLPAAVAAAIAHSATEANLELDRWEQGQEFLLVLETDRKNEPAFIRPAFLYQVLRGAFRRGVAPWPVYYRCAGPTAAVEVVLVGSTRRALVMPVIQANHKEVPETRVAFDLRPYVDAGVRKLPDYEVSAPAPEEPSVEEPKPEPQSEPAPTHVEVDGTVVAETRHIEAPAPDEPSDAPVPEEASVEESSEEEEVGTTAD
jgi:hypothetical protein